MDGHTVATDVRLRDFKFKIAFRLREERPLWERGGHLYTVSEALDIIRREVAEVGTVKA